MGKAIKTKTTPTIERIRLRTLSHWRCVDVVLALHGRLAWALVLYYAALGVWGIALGLRGGGPTPGFRGGIAISLLAAVAQGLLGLVSIEVVEGAGGALLARPRDPLHLLYGFAMVVALPLAMTVVRERTPRGQAIGLGLAALFTAGLAIRGITTS